MCLYYADDLSDISEDESFDYVQVQGQMPMMYLVIPTSQNTAAALNYV